MGKGSVVGIDIYNFPEITHITLHHLIAPQEGKSFLCCFLVFHVRRNAPHTAPGDRYGDLRFIHVIHGLNDVIVKIFVLCRINCRRHSCMSRIHRRIPHDKLSNRIIIRIVCRSRINDIAFHEIIYDFKSLHHRIIIIFFFVVVTLNQEIATNRLCLNFGEQIRCTPVRCACHNRLVSILIQCLRDRLQAIEIRRFLQIQLAENICVVENATRICKIRDTIYLAVRVIQRTGPGKSTLVVVPVIL